jgi:ribonucleoside-diphosphate reductase alpha chain
MVGLSANARRVLEARYLQRDAAGRLIEDFEGLCERVATSVAAAEADFGGDGDAGRVAARFFDVLLRREFLPNSPTLMNAGTPSGQLAACFVLPVDDSLASIFEAAKRTAAIHQSGGGTGFCFSRLRPAGDRVRESPGVASGPVSFIEIFDTATGVIRQGGRRRGANMGVIRIDHPDVFEFVRAKARPDRFANFNLSVATTDAFWKAALAGESFDLVNPRDGKVVRSIDAAELLDEIAENAWASGDPGVLFLDAIERANPTPQLGRLEATNPCGELPLLANESCNLGSLRLGAFVREAEIDWTRLDAVVEIAVRFLDDVIEATHYPFPEIAAATRASRKIGLGVMGFADFLVDLGVPYDSPEAAGLADRVMARIRAGAERASARLAEERGVFPSYEGSRPAARGLRLRNATVTSIAPAGTISILADCSAGIEPYFALAFTRHVLDGARLPEVNPRFEASLRRAGVLREDLLAAVRRTGSARGLAGIPETVLRLFPTAAEIAPEAHLDVQDAFQRHVDNAVSKTINLPADATPADVRAINLSAWRRGLKGVTVFREGCKGTAVLVRGADGAEVVGDRGYD